MLLLDMALPDEKGPIYQAMQAESPEGEKDFWKAVEVAHAAIEEARKEVFSQSRIRDNYATAAAEILKMREIPPVAVRLNVLLLYMPGFLDRGPSSRMQPTYWIADWSAWRPGMSGRGCCKNPCLHLRQPEMCFRKNRCTWSSSGALKPRSRSIPV